MAAGDHLGDQFRRMRVAELLPHAESDRMEVPRFRKNVDQIAESMRRYGYNNRSGDAFLRRQYGNYTGTIEHSPVTLWHTDQGSFIEPGNHRVHAAHLAGLERIPVLVRDSDPSA